MQTTRYISCKRFSMFHNVPSHVFYNFHFSGGLQPDTTSTLYFHSWYRRCIVYILQKAKKCYLNCWYDWMRWELAMNIPAHITFPPWEQWKAERRRKNQMKKESNKGNSNYLKGGWLTHALFLIWQNDNTTSFTPCFHFMKFILQTQQHQKVATMFKRFASTVCSHLITFSLLLVVPIDPAQLAFLIFRTDYIRKVRMWHCLNHKWKMMSAHFVRLILVLKLKKKIYTYFKLDKKTS